MDSLERWYALRTAHGREERAAELLRERAGADVFSCCRVLKKNRVFRSGGRLHILEDLMFPGYVFIKTARPGALAGETKKAGAFPQVLSFEASEASGERLVPLEEADVAFLEHVCGKGLERAMGISRVFLDQERRIVRADGVLAPYLDRIVRLNLHKRFAVVEAPLFNRMQPVLFGIFLEKDEWMGKEPGENKTPGEKKRFERCICCRRELDIPADEPIGCRAFYIEGAGQLCCECYHKIYG